MSAVNVVVRLKPGESQESLLKRFKQKVVKNGVVTLARSKRWFVSRSEQRRLDKKKAVRKYKRLAEEAKNKHAVL